MRYRDAAVAMHWSCRAFGFERQLVVPGENGRIEHAQLTLGRGLIMLGSGRHNAYGRHMGSPLDLDRRNTWSIEIVVDDIDAHYARAVEAGAEILQLLEDQG
ncbi:MAG: glyoxalase [Flavobacteriales bacterium]|nr:glyoxalase [Flavobacteriales bacterium]